MSDNDSENGEDQQLPPLDYDELDDEQRFPKIERQIYEAIQEAESKHIEANPPEGDDEPEPFDFDGWLETYQESNPRIDVNVIKLVRTYGIYAGKRDEDKVRIGDGETWYGNGDSYKGEFSDGEKNGHGLYVYKSSGSDAVDAAISKIAAENEQVKTLVSQDKYNDAAAIVKTVLAEQKLSSTSDMRIVLVLQYGPYAFYDGDYLNNLPHGQGLMKYRDGKLYRGEWKDGDRHGFGKLLYPNGDSYNGSWEAGKKSGTGTYFFAKTGSTYKGTWANGEIQSGTWDMKSGVRFEGKFENGQPHDSKGMISFASSQSEFEILQGEFKNGRWNPEQAFESMVEDEY